MVLLQPRLNLKVAQKQILTPGLVQMVSVLALNKIELKDMINAEMVENPVLEEFEAAVPLLDDISAKEEERDRVAAASQNGDDPAAAANGEKKDPFEEIDFGSFFQEYLDPGYRSSSEIEDIERPSFENFLSRPGTLTDHLMWQLGALHANPDVLEAAELVIGNLNEEGYLIASDEELLALSAGEILTPQPDAEPEPQPELEPEAKTTSALDDFSDDLVSETPLPDDFAAVSIEESGPLIAEPEIPRSGPVLLPKPEHISKARFSRDALHEAIDLVRQMDPAGVASRDLRECLLAQLYYLQERIQDARHSREADLQVIAIDDAIVIMRDHLKQLQLKQFKEIGRGINRPLEAVMAAVELIRTLDPKPGLRYNKQDVRLIEPDVAIVKHGDEFIVLMNDEDLPQLRLNPAYKKLLNRDAAEKDVRNYVKERYKSAIQLIKNIEQRKQTILKVCYAIIGRQEDFLDKGIDQLKPMMIKEVAEEIGVHPSTVSRAVANKYVHTPQGVFELRYFFSESVQGPEGGNTSLLILKRRVKKLIEEEDPARPLTDEQITRILQSQGIQVTRRTVAKYREDMKIPSTHQRRVKG
jgi:RNA polymerase sigma-54 factor